MRLHDLRHTFGTLAVQAFPLSDVNAYMGHAQIETTMSYVHHVPHHDAADKLTALVAYARRPVSVHLRAPGRSRCDRASPPPSSRVDVTNSLASGPRISSITNIRPLRSGLTPGPSRKPRNSAAPGFRKVCRSARRCFQLRRRPGVERMATHGGEGPGSQRIRPPASGAPGGHGRPPFCRSAARCLPLVPASLGAATRQAGLWPGIPPNLMRRPALTLRGPGDGKERASQGYIPSPWRTRGHGWPLSVAAPPARWRAGRPPISGSFSRSSCVGAAAMDLDRSVGPSTSRPGLEAARRLSHNPRAVSKASVA